MMTSFNTYREYINMDISSIATLRHAEVFRPILVTAKFIDRLSGDTHLFDSMSSYVTSKIAVRDSNSDDTPEELLKAALVSLFNDSEDDVIEVNANDIKNKMHNLTIDSMAWCNEAWIGKNLKKLGIITCNNSIRKRSEGKQLRYYKISREHMDICIQSDWAKYRLDDCSI